VDETYGHGRLGFPAICMTQHAAMEYCSWLSKKTGKAYRLPTEAEWEYACRAGSKTAYSFGDDPKTLGDYAWFEGNSDEHTHKVATKKPNPWGLYDMHGNVMEWCIDHYGKDSYAKFPADKATLGPVLLPTDKRFSHVARGGSWTDPAGLLRSAARRGSDKTWIKKDPQRPQSIWWLTEMDVVGFRVVRAVEEQANLKGIRSKVVRKSPNY
jgi:formylglycine-generating enzyme required for sulfatase activity